MRSSKLLTCGGAILETAFRPQADPPGEIMRTCLSAAHRIAVIGVLVLSFGAAQAQTRPPMPTDEELRSAFNAADVNKDSVIDIDESVGNSILIFATLDKNKDGYLSFDELPGYDPNRLKRADRNDDGKLSIGEVASDRVWEFFEADTDRNGVITFEEVRLYIIKLRGARK
jgi:Ca2+-binding EF-hand superfamily protein